MVVGFGASMRADDKFFPWAATCALSCGVGLAVAEGLVAGFVFGVDGVEAGERCAGLDFVDDPGFEFLLLGGFFDDFLERAAALPLLLERSICSDRRETLSKQQLGGGKKTY